MPTPSADCPLGPTSYPIGLESLRKAFEVLRTKVDSQNHIASPSETENLINLAEQIFEKYEDIIHDREY